jgi:hypothetical protein
VNDQRVGKVRLAVRRRRGFQDLPGKRCIPSRAGSLVFADPGKSSISGMVAVLFQRVWLPSV